MSSTISRRPALAGAVLLGTLAACNAILGTETGIFDPEFGHDAADEATADDGGPPSDATPDRAGDGASVDGNAGDASACGAGAKSCFDACVPANDPSLGCADNACAPCSVANASAACAANGACTIATCTAPFSDCNGDPSDGCEKSLAVGTSCGSCDQKCAASAPYCVADGGSYDCVTNCPASQPTLCTNTNTCADTTSDPQHCGACTTVCSAPAGGTPVCNGSACDFVCNGAGSHNCAPSCVSNRSPASCGPVSCTPCAGPASNGSAVCADPVNGTCGIQCNGGYHLCTPGGAPDCKSDTDTAYCGPSCVQCTPGANVATTKCASGQCAVGTCNPGYDDLDGNPANGCETPNPLTVGPADLALWLRSDVGIVSDVNGVSQWTDQSGKSNNAIQTTTTLRPSTNVGSWPGRPNATTVSFDGTRELNVDLSAFASGAGFSLFVAEARYGTGAGQFIGAGVYVAAPGCCTGDQGKMVDLGYTASNQFRVERTCTVLFPTVPANGAMTYQPRQSALTFDTQLVLTFGTSTVVADESGLPGFACAGTRPQAATMSMNGKIGSSPTNLRYNGLIGDVIMYKRTLSASEMSTIRAYLSAKWGVP